MKILNKKAAVILFAALFTTSVFAQEVTEESAEVSEITESQTTEEAAEIPATETPVVKSDEDDEAVVPTSKYGDVLKVSEKSFLQRIINSDRYVSYDVCYLSTGDLTGGIKEKAAEVSVNTKKMMAGFGASYLTSYYRVNLTDEERNQLANACERYLKDFENKRLSRKNSKTYRAYGKDRVYIEWGTMKGNLPYEGTTNIFFGYKFVKGSPYFTIQVDKAYCDQDLIGITESMVCTFYFTKAQIQELVSKLTDPEVEAFLHISEAINNAPEVEAQGDEY